MFNFLKSVLIVAVISPLMLQQAIAREYVEITPEFVVNYGSGVKLRFMKFEISVQLEDSGDALDVNIHADLIRHEMILLMSRQEGATLTSVDGKIKIQEEALELIQKVFMEEFGKKMVSRVLFLNFIVQ
ncbi:MAG: flagellar basal body-associated FliL family protein [Saccharospirillaceae bacterium]|nr:flagellar basal body-associated FliL family protein [Pseudomonadales bacterium]NRB78251.1 flagellar basal body-associated FliL family protein [Saccharospirillaceae bacterium]